MIQELKQFFQREGDLAYWADVALHARPRGWLYGHTIVHFKEMTQTVPVEGKAMTITTVAGMDYIGTNVGWDRWDYVGDRPFASHFEAGIAVQTYVVVTSLPLVDLADLVFHEVKGMWEALDRLNNEWKEFRGVRLTALTEAAAKLAGATSYIVFRNKEATGAALRQALQMLPLKDWAVAVQDQRFRSLD